jgi:hypothetical protein
MVKTKVINGTTQELIWREGTAGTYRIGKRVLPKADFYFHSDPNATYREFDILVGGSPIRISTDDIYEYSKIELYETQDGKITWRGTEEQVHDTGAVTEPEQPISKFQVNFSLGN